MTMARLFLLPAAVALSLAIAMAGGDPKTVKIKVEGMTCGGCASKVQKAVGALDGVEKTTVDVKGGYAEVVYASSSLSPDDIAASIAGAGFKASPVKAGSGPADAARHEAAVQKDAAGPASNAQLDDIRARLAKVKNGLMMEGKYACCISPSCDFCAMAVNGCPCGENLSKGKPVCGECKGGWTAGHGTMPDIDPKDVKTIPDADVKKMYESRAKLIKASKPAKEEKK